MAQDDHGSAIWPDFVCGKPATEHRRHTQQLEQVWRREQHHGLQRLSVRPSGYRGGGQPQTSDPLDHIVRVLQIGHVRARERIACQAAGRGLIAPDEVQVVRLAIRHALKQDFVDGRVHNRERAESHGQRSKRRGHEYPRAQQATMRELEVTAPIAGAPPGGSGPQTLAKAVPERISERT